MANQAYLGRFYYASVSPDVAVAGLGSVNLTSGYYYGAGYSGESTAQFVEHLQARIRTLGGAAAAATVSLSLTTGLVSFTLGSTAAITFGSTLQDLLGLTGALSGDTSYTAPNPMRYLWLPTNDMATHSVAQARFWVPRSTTQIVRAKDGTPYSVIGHSTNAATVRYALLPKADAIATDGTYGSLEHFFSDVAHAGQPLRILPDKTSYTSSSYLTGMIAAPGEGGALESFADLATMRQSNYQGLWDVSLSLVEYA